MQTLPFYVYAIFDLTVIAAIGLFYKAANYAKPFLIIISLWVVFQSILGMNDFYKVNTTPPRFLLLVLPPVLYILTSLMVPAGKRFIDSLNIKTLTILHTIRIPVEIVLYWLFLHSVVPKVMTFEGRNFDILAGLSAPLVWYFGFVKGTLNKAVLLIWNLISLGLLLNIVTIAMITVTAKLPPSVPERPTIALVYFPFLLLPACLVPLVLFSHLAAIRQLLKELPTRSLAR
ncbi:hypothetical protein HHL17_08540 [Chitinophaga sp. G-6-1-13]|uniref:Uncharacterized protein n=1 Tax=Chitinophaga fulva TaxID=2728842 RepID=A0A848GF22_9BACT|nr:hypothetical protein [Chitinophaga fulva]NML37245.1 hypothetical protein [Chitinophaga fulva]